MKPPRPLPFGLLAALLAAVTPVPAQTDAARYYNNNYVAAQAKVARGDLAGALADFAKAIGRDPTEPVVDDARPN